MGQDNALLNYSLHFISVVMWMPAVSYRRIKVVRIMLVEDNDSIIMGVEYLLSREGFQVLTAKSIKMADEILRQMGCDLILLDIALPDGDGFIFCRKIKQTTEIPVIFLTAKEDEADVVRGLDIPHLPI